MVKKKMCIIATNYILFQSFFMVLKSIQYKVVLSLKIVCLFQFIVFGVFAQSISKIPLYTDTIPNNLPNYKKYPADYANVSLPGVNEKNKANVYPDLTAYIPASPNGLAVLICPGGGYGGLAINHEGKVVAEALNKLGISAFVLRYRLPNDNYMTNKHLVPLQDAQRAMQIIRTGSYPSPANITFLGILGFSAGGHLASTVATHFDFPQVDTLTTKAKIRPDFCVLVYPVISTGVYRHDGSVKNLLGKTPTDNLLKLFSNELQVTALTPPTFLVHAGDDKGVSVRNSLLFYQALLDKQVQAELHVYPYGGHGFGLVNKTTPDFWLDRLQNWLKANKWL